MCLPVVSIILLASSAFGVLQTPNPQPPTLKRSSHVPVPELPEDTTIGNKDGADYGDYIVGGKEVSPKNELGYQAHIKECVIVNRRQKCRDKCGGTVIHPQYVITAAHCLNWDKTMTTLSNETSYIVVVGEHNICDKTGQDSSDGSQKFVTSEVFAHPKFNTPERANDIAIIKLPRDIIFNDRVSPACLPASDTKDYMGQSVTVSGWGATEGHDENDEEPEQDKQCILKKATLKIMAYSDLVCSKVLKSKKPDPSRLCAYYPGRDACQGDSGGPLTLKQGNRSVLLGVTSYGLGCADSQNAGIFTRVQGFLPWITEQMQK